MSALENARGAHAALRAALAGAARRWRNRRLLEGVCAAAVSTLVVAVLAIALMDSQRFDPGVVSLARTAVYLAAAALALVFMLARVPWRRDAHALARHLEARDPALDALLLTAVQVHRDGAGSSLSQRLFQRAAAACEDPHGATREDRTGQRRAALWLALIVGVPLFALLLAGPAWRHGALLLALPLADARDGMPYAVRARPGAITVLENSDLAVHGEASGFAPGAMVLLHRGEGEPGWTRMPMEAGDDGAFRSLLVGVSVPFEYQLEAQGVRSEAHRVAVQWLPRMEGMQHRYRYPDYTGLGERVVEDATTITAVSGTQVELRVQPAVAGAAGELVLDGEQRRALVRDGDVLSASLGVDEASRYRIELATGDGASVAVTPEHPIRALADEAPGVRLVSPGADARVTPVEEVRIEVQAEDDVSLRRVELVLSVNGQPEEVVALGAGDTVLRALHTLHLEERDLTPGDVIAVHARASDGVAARTAVTDLLFMEVRPFDRDYSRGRSGGRQGGGGGGGEGEPGLAAQQRDLVVALFRLSRDAARLSAQEQTERLTILSDAQARIRGRVEAIVRRIQGRAVVQTTPGYQVMLEEMPRATAAMLRVEALLAVPAPEEALPRAREALAHLQRADAAFREVRVAEQQRGGGGGGRSDNADLSRLFELEMDRLRNRYSEVQRAAPQQQRQQQLDETLRKLEELARRQQQEVDRARRRATRSDLAGRGAATQQQLAQELEELLRRLERLSREQSSAAMDAARRELEQAARAMREAGSQSGSQDRAQQARGQAQGQAQGQPGQQAGSQQGRQDQGQASQGGAQGGAQGQPSPGQGGGAAGTRGAEQAARDALDRIEQARAALGSEGAAQVARELEDARRRAESLAQRQEQMRERLAQGESATGAGGVDPSQSAPRRGRAPGAGSVPDRARRAGGGDLPRPPQSARQGSADGGQRDGEAATAGTSVGEDAGGARELDEAKAAMEADATALRAQLDRIAEQAGAEQLEAGRRTRSAASIMREEDVEGRLRRSREELAAGVPDPGLENAIGRALDRVRERVSEAAQAAADAAGQGGREAAGSPTAQGLRALMQELAGLREHTRDRTPGNAGPGGRDASGLQNLAGTLDSLRGPVARNPGATGDLETLIDGIESLATDGAAMTGGPQRDAFLQALAGVERAIAELSAGAGDRDALPAGRDARAPDRYRALVEDYYRRLSRE